MQKLRGRRVAAVLSVLLGACALNQPLRSWQAIADLETGTNKGAAEGGQTAPVVAPPGVTWTAQLDAVIDEVVGPAYHLTLEFQDSLAPASGWRLSPTDGAAELVDDEGGRFRCAQVLVPDAPGVDPKPEAGVARASYVFVFPVGGSYRFAAMTRVAVHWQLRIDTEPTAITTRFRS